MPSRNVHRLAPLPHADQLWAESEVDGPLYAIDLQGKAGQPAAALPMPGPLNSIASARLVRCPSAVKLRLSAAHRYVSNSTTLG